MSTKSEVYKSSVHAPIVNYKDATTSDASAAINFNDAIVQQTQKHKSDRYDLFCLDQILKVRNGEVHFSEINEDFHDFCEEFQSANDAKLQTSFINNDSTEFSWVAPNASSTKLAKSDSDDANTLFESAVNQLVKEEEAYGMAIKVFICDQCHAGTSYTAQSLQNESHFWTCNQCSSLNDTSKNQFYIYNKPDVSMISLLDIAEARTSILNAYDDIKEYAEPKEIQFDSEKGELPENEDDEIVDIGTAPFFQNIKTLKIKTQNYGKEAKSTTDSYFSGTTINVNVGCSEVELKDSTSFYCFWLQFADWEFISELENFIHRLMFIPKTKDVKLDELLAVLTDDLNRLVSEGIHFDQEGERKVLKLNILNLNGSKAVIDDLKAKTESSTLLKLTNVNGVIIPNFTEIIINNATKSLLKKMVNSISEEDFEKLKKEIDLKIDEEDPEPELPEEVKQDEEEDEEVQADDGDSDFEDVESEEEYDDHEEEDPLTGEDLQNFKDTNEDFSLNKYHTILLLLPEILELIETIPTEYITLFGLLRAISFCATGSEVCIGDLKQLQEESKEFITGFEKLVSAEEVAAVQPLLQITRYFKYFGPLERFSKSELQKNEVERISETYDTEKYENVINSLGKADVVLNNYFNVYERVFETGDSCVDDDLLSSRFEAMIIGGLHDHGHSHSHGGGDDDDDDHSHGHSHGHTHGGEPCGGHSH